MIVYVFYVDVENDFTFTVEYFCLIAVGNCNATGLFETLATQIKAVKDKRGKMWLWEKWMAFGTDGPTVMTSEENGVWGLVKAVKPQMFTQHCVGHRAHLGARDCMEDVPFCKNLDEHLRALGRYYSWSTERRVDLKRITMDNDDPQTQVDLACATRWLSRDKAASSVVDKYESVTQQHYENKDNNPTSLGLYNKLTDYRYMGGLCHVSDILAKWAGLSRVFQTKILDGYTVDTKVEQFIQGMERYAGDDDPSFFGPELQRLIDQIPNYDDAEPADFTYGGKEAGGFRIGFTAAKRKFIENFAKELAAKSIGRIKERFPMNELLRAFDVFDRRRFVEGDQKYGDAEINKLAKHYAPVLGVTEEEVASAWDDFRAVLSARPSTETWQQTYRHFKQEWTMSDSGGALEVLMDIKAVIVFASVCCETGFSRMKEAKKERQANMCSKTLDVRLRIQMLSPKDPRTESHENDAAFKRAQKKYNKCVSAIINKAITMWGPAAHKTEAAVTKHLAGSQKRGKEHKDKKKHRTDGDLGEFLLGNEGMAVLKRKAESLPGSGAAPSTTREIPPPPAYTPLEDALTIAPCVDLKNADPTSLVGQTLVLLFKVELENNVFIDWEWHAAPIVKASRRSRDKHVVVDVKFPGDKGKIRQIDLSDGKQYTPTPSAGMATAWVLQNENREGAKKRKETKKKRKKDANASDSDAEQGAGEEEEQPAPKKPKKSKKKKK